MNDFHQNHLSATWILDGTLSSSRLANGINPTMYENGDNPSDYHFLRMTPVGVIKSNVSTRMELCDDNAQKYSYAYTKFCEAQNASSNYTFHMLMVVNDTMYADYIVHLQTYSYKISSTTSVRTLSAKNEVFNFTNKKFIFDYQQQGTSDHNLKIGLDMSTVNDTEMLFHVRFYIYNLFALNAASLVHAGTVSTNSNPYSSNKRIITPS